MNTSQMHATHVDPRTKKDSNNKHVRWGAVSVLEFQVWYNASAVPESGGPPLGLIGRPICQSHSMLADVTDSDCENVRSNSDTEFLEASVSRRRSRSDLWFDPMDRIRILMKDAAFDMDDIVLICQDLKLLTFGTIYCCVRWSTRLQLLTKADTHTGKSSD
ncbi:hypothetical protein PsorP6_010145 [Peronosclerospora sorghi]|uniref:Uncharacterized protein n=1 Tax=Peronosclerospora sorghi TaxID=230839 RepID=A0ACC0VXS7_9STRA|nr:hypothetical protein PsorP6_010145 [Peronosclerospora sorghi]